MAVEVGNIKCLSPENQLRSFFSPYAQSVVGKLHEKIPNLKPDHLTAIGIVGTGIVNAIDYLLKQKKSHTLLTRLLTASAYGFFSVFDFFDGTLADMLENNNHKNGQVHDAVGDRIVEGEKGSLDVLLSKNLLTLLLNVSSTTLRPWASERKALIERNNKKCKDGYNIVGTRWGSAIANVIEISLDEKPDQHVSPKDIVRGIKVVSDLASVLCRHKILTDKTLPYDGDDIKKELAEIRYPYLRNAAIGITAIALIFGTVRLFQLTSHR